MKTMLMIAMFAPLFALAGCTSPAPSQPEAAQPEQQPVGIANPASVYCAEQGGTVEFRQQPDGTAGYCHLPDGRVVEEWEFYRAQHPQPE